jgi:hypothetical protein
MKNLLLILSPILILCSLGSDDAIDDRVVLLHGDREAPLGWVTFEMYEDSTFKFISAGLRDEDVYNGRFEIWDGLISLIYEDSVSKYLGNYIHISGNDLYGERGLMVTNLSINRLDSVYGNNSYFDCYGLDRTVAANLTLLERHNEIPSNASGYYGTPSKHMEATIEFKKLISIDDALILYNHPSGFIKTLAFKKLWYSKDSSVFDKLVVSFTDSAVVYRAEGCELGAYKLADYYLEVIGYPNETSSRFNTIQKSIIDSLAENYNLKYNRPPNRKGTPFN